MPPFTAETARKAAILSHAAQSARNHPVILPDPPAIIPQPAAILRDDFQNRRLKRVREQLSRIDTELETCPLKDSKRLKELADASARLSDQEFKLAGRPSPGSRRPAQERAPTAQDAGAWIMDLPPASTITAPVVGPAQPVVPVRPMGWEYDTPTGSVPLATVCQPPAQPSQKPNECADSMSLDRTQQPIQPIAQPDRLPGDVTP